MPDAYTMQWAAHAMAYYAALLRTFCRVFTICMFSMLIHSRILPTREKAFLKRGGFWDKFYIDFNTLLSSRARLSCWLSFHLFINHYSPLLSSRMPFNFLAVLESMGYFYAEFLLDKCSVFSLHRTQTQRKSL